MRDKSTRSRRLILGLIILTLLATCLAAAAKLRATPKYDRVQVGMTEDDVRAILGPEDGKYVEVLNGALHTVGPLWKTEEELIVVGFQFQGTPDGDLVTSKRIIRRGPLERLAWLAGWR